MPVSSLPFHFVNTMGPFPLHRRSVLQGSKSSTNLSTTHTAAGVPTCRRRKLHSLDATQLKERREVGQARGTAAETRASRTIATKTVVRRQLVAGAFLYFSNTISPNIHVA